MMLPLVVFALLSATASLAMAESPGEVVRQFYVQPGLELEASARDNFIDPARKVLNQNDDIRQDGELGCLDPALPFNDTRSDAMQAAGTLRLEELVSGPDATVIARFVADDAEHAVQWQLRDVDGRWRVADFMSMTKDWALSRFQCE